MFLRTQTTVATVIIGLSTTPVSAAIMDIYAIASITELSRSGFFETGLNPSEYTFILPEVEPEVFDTFKGINIGDNLLIQWKLNTEAGADWDQDPEDNSIVDHYAYPGGPVTATFMARGTNWHVGNSEGSSVTYTDLPDEFSMKYYSGDNAEDTLGGYPSGAFHNTTVDMRPDDYVANKGLMNTFNYSGDNLGSGTLDLISKIIVEKRAEPYVDHDVYSSLKLNYQITSFSTSALRDIDIAPVPLPSGILLFASGLLGFGLLRRRQA